MIKSNSYAYRVFFYEVFAEELELFLQMMPSGLNVGYSPYAIQESRNLFPPAPVISTRTQSIIPEEWLPKLKAVLGRCTGYDYLQSLRVKNPNLKLGYLPKYCARAVAEQAMLLWSALLRKLPQQMQQFTHFNRDGITGSENSGKVLLVVGVGNIGYEIVKIGRGLDMKVFGVDIVKKHPDVNYVDFDQALPEADIIVSAMNLTPENVGYFSYQRMLKSKPSAIFVNIARGEQSPLKDLLRLLQEKKIAGVALDVYPDEGKIASLLRQGSTDENEDLEIISQLLKLPNVILTPHNAFNTREAVIRKVKQSVQQIVNFLEKEEFIWEVPF